MRKTLFSLCLLGVAAAVAQELQSPEQAWARIVLLRRTVTVQVPKTDADKAVVIDQLSELVNAANEFWQLNPDSPHMWDAKLIALQSSWQRSTLEGKQPNIHIVESDVREITEGGIAPLLTRAEAAYWLLQLHAQAITDSSKLGVIDSECAEFIRRYPTASQVVDATWLRLAAYERLAPAKADALLRQLAQDKDARIATEATRRVAIQDLTKKPLDLKFTAVDGTEFDLAKWRGKVVLVDFWATWCGPCRMELPHVIATYNKLHGQGLEIIGISLDRDKNALTQFVKQQQLSWPQYFDGQMWNNRVSSKYGIAAIPAMWLIDKRGFVRSTDARADFEAQAAKLLAE